MEDSKSVTILPQRSLARSRFGASLRALAAYARRSPQARETSVHSKPVDVVDPFARRRLDHGPLTKSACAATGSADRKPVVERETIA
jgi:hypothetical protein